MVWLPVSGAGRPFNTSSINGIALEFGIAGAATNLVVWIQIYIYSLPLSLNSDKGDLGGSGRGRLVHSVVSRWHANHRLWSE